MVDRYNLISIKINNIRGLADVEIDFTENGKPREIMTFFGHQGSGKSTIILAIQWCAYGTDLKSKKQKLSKINLYPDVWDGVHKDTMSVTLRFRDSSNPDVTNRDIICKRMLLPGKERDDIEVFVGEKKSDRFESREYFNQIFGSIPSIQDGVMWVVRTEEMAKMAQTIATNKSSESYFLNFMNLNVPHDGLKELSETKRKSIKRLMPKGKGVSQATLDHLETQIRLVKGRMEKAKEKYDQMAIELRDSRPTSNDEAIAESGTDYKEAKRDLDNALERYEGVKIKRLEIENLITTLLAAKLKSKGVKIEKSFDSAKFEWGEIADYLELTNTFPASVISQIRELQDGVGYDTSRLINSSNDISSWLNRIERLKKARKNFNACQAIIDDYHHRNINEKTTLVALEKSEKAKSLREGMRLKVEDINEFERELDGLKEERDNVAFEIAKTAKNKKQLLMLRKQKKVIDALISIINDTNREYESKMFEDMISSVKDYWKRIDQIGTYRPVLVQEPKPQLALQRIADERIRYIELGDETGKASGGEDQLLLVCTCLAVSATSGAKMPIILDDCFTVVDTDSRKALVNTVAQDFKNMIFVTNDKNNQKLFTSSQGTLNLQWPTSLGTAINKENASKWHRWIPKGGLE